MSKINPCSFCNQKPDVRRKREERKREDGEVITVFRFFVLCACEAHGPLKDTKDAAISAWNTPWQHKMVYDLSRGREGYGEF